MKYRKLTPDELNAIEVFAADKGKMWKLELSMKYWYNARVYRGPDGKEYPILHRMRNEFGPSWLESYKLPKKPRCPLCAAGERHLACG